MKRLSKLAIIGAALAVAGAAQAADLPAPVLPTKKSPPAPYFTNPKWTGGYAGLTGGAHYLESTAPGFQPKGYSAVNSAGLPYGFRNGAKPAPLSYSSNGLGGFALGLYGGYNWLVAPHIVAGVEADASHNWGKAKARSYFAANPQDPAKGSTAYGEARAPWSGTLRARLGYTITNNVMLFATGGLAFAQIEKDATERLASLATVACAATATCPVATWNVATGKYTVKTMSATGANAGWTVGGGAEGFITDNVSLKGEYLFTRYPGAKIDTHTGRFGLSQHF